MLIDISKRRKYSLHVFNYAFAQMVELVDTPASGAGGLRAVEVQVLFWAPD